MSLPQLYCVQGQLRGRRFELGADSATVFGRHPGDKGIALTDSLASRRHARFTAEGDRLVVEDLGSSNGTWVNGQRIGEAYALAPGDLVTIGLSSLLVEDPTSQRAPADTATHPPLEEPPGPTAPQVPLPAHQESESSAVLTPDFAAEVLLSLLVAMPLALLLLDHDGRPLLVNDAMKALCGLDVSSIQPGAEVLAMLSARLQRPQELHNLITGHDQGFLELATTAGERWRAWYRRVDQGDMLFVLPEG
ncbi:MAG: FHA domain-containing protein [Planctomycetota bacterium]